MLENDKDNTAAQVVTSHGAFVPRRVSIVLTELRAGGAERVVMHLSRQFVQWGIATQVICLGQAGALADEVRSGGAEVVAINSTRGFDFRSLWRLRAVLREARPDVINVHDRASLPYVQLANRFAGRRPVVFSGHGLLLKDNGRLRDRIFGRRLDMLTAVSQTAADEYRRIFTWRDEAMVISNGVPVVDRCPALREKIRAEMGIGEETFAFLAVGNIKPEKGYDDLIEAADYLNRNTNRKFNVWIAGAFSNKEYANRLEGRVRELTLSGCVRFLGYRSDTMALYLAADAFVLSSRKEALPMVLLEAMSSALPVVATRVGGVGDVVEDHQSGLMVSPFRPVELAEAMKEVLAGQGWSLTMAQAGRRRVVQDFGVEKMADQYLQAYAQAARPRVLMLGPLPPLTGGMATVVDNLRKSALAESCRLEVMNNGKITQPDRSLLAGIMAQVQIGYAVINRVIAMRARIVHIHTCAKFSFWRDCLHMLAFRLLGRLVVWHIHDGSFAPFMAQGSRLRREFIRWALRCGSAVVVLSELSRRAQDFHGTPGFHANPVPG